LRDAGERGFENDNGMESKAGWPSLAQYPAMRCVAHGSISRWGRHLDGVYGKQRAKRQMASHQRFHDESRTSVAQIAQRSSRRSCKLHGIPGDHNGREYPTRRRRMVHQETRSNMLWHRPE